MTDKNPTPEDGDEVQPAGEGPEAQASGPQPQDEQRSHDESVQPDPLDDAAEADGLTVQDILDAADGLPEASGEQDLASQLAFAKEELAREQAAFFNFRRAREAQAELERDRTRGDIVKVLLPVLDDLDRAEKHGDLEGDAPFSTIAAKLRASVEKLGLTPFGSAGDAFDPNLHEAIFQQPSPDVSVETVLEVVETGYKLGETLLRAAKVVVAVPSE